MILKKYPFVHQRENKDCGVACLSMIVKYYNGCINEDTLYDMTKTNKKGTNAYNLIEAAKTIGFKSAGIKCEIGKLSECNFPCIAHVTVEEKYGHYIVIYNINEKHKTLYIGDPAKKRMKMSFEEFEKIFSGIIITMLPEKPLPVYENSITVTNYIKKLFYSYKNDWIKLWLESILCMMVSISFSLALVIMIKIIKLNSEFKILSIMLMFICLGITKSFITYVQEKSLCNLQHKINNHLMIQAIKNIILLPYKFYCNRSTGEIISRLQDLEKVSYGLSQIMILIGMDSIMFITSGYLLYLLNQTLFKLSIICIVLYILIAYIFRNILKDKINKVKQKYSIMYNNLIESIKGFETIKGLQLEEKQINILSKQQINYNNDLYDYEITNGKQKLIKNIINDIWYILILGIGCLQVLDGNMQLNELIAYQTLFAYFLLPVEHILELNVSICDMEKSLERAIDILYLDQNKKMIPCKRIKTIELKKLTYEREDSVLKNISLKIHSGEKILIMGPSGSGKSTILKIIRGYYEAANGNVYINNLDLNLYDKNSIGNKITYISQNEILFTDTIYNNITLDRNCKETDIIKQIKLNDIDAITKNKITGLQDIVEENGYNLSGGERQRIILARSLLKKSDVLLIDEGFSQMDNNLERKILKRLFKLYPKKTIVVVSHRKDNIDLFDTYLELKSGQVHKYLTKSKC